MVAILWNDLKRLGLYLSQFRNVLISKITESMVSTVQLVAMKKMMMTSMLKLKGNPMRIAQLPSILCEDQD